MSLPAQHWQTDDISINVLSFRENVVPLQTKLIIKYLIDMKYTEEQRLYAWKMARTVEGTDENMFRQDACGAWMRWDMYGNRNNDYGWEIDHIYPESRGGTDIPENLRALQWENNLTKGDDYPCYMAAKTSQGIENVSSNRFLMINEKKREQLRQYYTNA